MEEAEEEGLAEQMNQLDVDNLEGGAMALELPNGLVFEEEYEEEEEEDDGSNGYKAARIFPEEVWVLILRLAVDEKNPDQVWQVSRTCQLFQGILIQPSINVWLFNQIFPHLFEHMDGRSILKCRAVCKDWRDKVDDYLENHPSLHPHDDTMHSPDKPIWRSPMEEKGIGLYRFCEDDSLFRQMYGHPRNPFIGRSVIASRWCNPEKLRAHENRRDLDILENDLCQKFITTLEKLGEHIWYIEVWVDWDLRSEDGTVQSLVNRFLSDRLLRLLPNLRKLKVAGYLEQDEGDDTPLPQSHSHPNLVELDLDIKDPGGFFEDTLPRKVEMQLLARYHGQLKCLRMENMRLLNWECMYNFEWSNLAELDLGNISGPLAVEAIPQLLSETRAPNVRKLIVSLDDLPSEYFRFFLIILTTLCSGTMPLLSTLRLVVRSYTPLLESSELVNIIPGLDAPRSISTLEIFDYTGIGFVDLSTPDPHNLLHPFRFIEQLSCFPPPSYEVATDSSSWTVEVKLNYEKIYSSSIWQLMPHLKIITDGRTICTRQEYEAHHAAKNARQ